MGPTVLVYSIYCDFVVVNVYNSVHAYFLRGVLSKSLQLVHFGTLMFHLVFEFKVQNFLGRLNLSLKASSLSVTSATCYERVMKTQMLVKTNFIWTYMTHLRTKGGAKHYRAEVFEGKVDNFKENYL